MKFLNDLLGSGTLVSSKRFITIGAFTLMGIAFMANLFFKLTIMEFLYDSMSYIVIAGLGFTASEFLARKPVSSVAANKAEYDKGYAAAKAECLSGNITPDEDMG
jgi:hypothetical protein